MRESRTKQPRRMLEASPDRSPRRPVQWMLLIGAVVGIGIGSMNFSRKMRAGGSP